MFIARAFIIVSAIVCTTITHASAQQQRRDRDWVPLGCWEIQANGQEVALIRVDVGNRRFSSLRLVAEGVSVRMYDLKVTYPTGNFDGYPISQTLNSGNSTFPIDFVRPREIREIEVAIVSQAISRDGRRICALGSPAREAPGQAEWREIGCHTVDFRRDMDQFRVSRDIGAISNVRLNVRENSVRVMYMKVNYFGGASEEVKVDPRDIFADRRSRRLELKQGPQRIREIELYYESIPRIGGRAVVCVEGRIEPGQQQPPVPPIDMSKMPPPEPGWERFACQAVDQQQDSSKIYVGRDRGRYNDIQVQAFENSVRIEKLDVTFINQTPKHLEPFRVDRNNSFYLPVGNRSAIETIDLTYRTSLNTSGQAIVCINGRKSDRSDRDDGDRPGQTAWKLIGCQPVKSAAETDVYEIGRDEGPFRRIRFSARRNDVILRAMRLVYDSGEADRLLVSNDRDIVIRRGEQSDEFDLPGYQRVVQKIELRYRAGGDWRDEAVLCIEGLPGRGRDDDGGRWRRESISNRP
jgi:hypothetical protein